jgi:hypothetical protein
MVTVELKRAVIRVFIVGGSAAAQIEADWSATGTPGLVVDLEAKRANGSWTKVATNQPPVHFIEAPLQVTPGERRIDFRAVARDAKGNTWESNVITVM